MNAKDKGYLKRIARILRLDWSGEDYDGRDSAEWLQLLWSSRYEELEKELKKQEKEEA